MTTPAPVRRRRRSKGEEPPHGTHARYDWDQDPCRCPACTSANTRRVNDYRAAGYRPPPKATRPKPAKPPCPHTDLADYPPPIGTVCTACGQRRPRET